jgi:hypothetical protein
MSFNGFPDSIGVKQIPPKTLNPGWDKREYMDSETGKVVRSYYYKGKRCKRVPLNSRLACQLAGYSLIEKDLRNCINWLLLIEGLYEKEGISDKANYSISPNRETFNLVKGLYVAMITFYGKCFASCEGRKIKLERNQLAEEFRSLHDLCIEHRNNYTAHSGAAKIEECEIAFVHAPIRGFGKPVVFNIFSELQQPDSMLTEKGAEGGDSLKELFEHVRAVAKAKIELLVDKIKKEEISSSSFSK